MGSPALDQGAGYGVVLGLGFAFALGKWHMKLLLQLASHSICWPKLIPAPQV